MQVMEAAENPGVLPGWRSSSASSRPIEMMRCSQSSRCCLKPSPSQVPKFDSLLHAQTRLSSILIFSVAFNSPVLDFCSLFVCRIRNGEPDELPVVENVISYLSSGLKEEALFSKIHMCTKDESAPSSNSLRTNRGMCRLRRLWSQLEVS